MNIDRQIKQWADAIVKESCDDILKEVEDDNKEVDKSDQEPTEDVTDKDAPKDDEQPSDEQTDEMTTFEEFLKNTNTNVVITKVSTEPSPIFGPNDTREHNKYKVTVKNAKGSVWFFFWDSIYNTEHGNTPSIGDVMSSFALDASAMIDGKSLQEFKDEFGYDESNNSLAQKAYEGCKKMVERAKKLFDEDQINKLIEIGSNY